MQDFSPRLRTYLVIGLPAQALGLKRSVLNQQDFEQEPPGLQAGWISPDRSVQAELGLSCLAKRQASASLSQVGGTSCSRAGIDRSPVLKCRAPVAGASCGLSLAPQPCGRIGS